MAEHVFTDDEIRQIIDVINRTKHTQYIGARYVPIFGRKNEESIEWDNSKPYEPLTIVLYQGNSYTTRQFTPAGIDINNKVYWANTGNYNAQIEQYRQTVESYRQTVEGFDDRITANTTSSTNANNKLSAMGVVSIQDGTDFSNRVGTIENNSTFNSSLFNAMGIKNIDDATRFKNTVDTTKSNSDTNASNIADNTANIANNTANIANLDETKQDKDTRDTMVVFGDSMTVKASETNKQYWSILAGRLGLKVKNYGVGGAGFNPVSGSTTYNNEVDNAIADATIDKNKVKYVIISASTNDQFNDSSTISSKADEVFAKIKNNYPNAMVYVLGGLSGAWIRYLTDNTQNKGDYCRYVINNATVCKIAAGYGFNPVVYSYTWLLYNEAYTSNDGLHPNDAGLKVIADNLYNVIANGNTSRQWSTMANTGQHKFLKLKEYTVENTDDSQLAFTGDTGGPWNVFQPDIVNGVNHFSLYEYGLLNLTPQVIKKFAINIQGSAWYGIDIPIAKKLLAFPTIVPLGQSWICTNIIVKINGYQITGNYWLHTLNQDTRLSEPDNAKNYIYLHIDSAMAYIMSETKPGLNQLDFATLNKSTNTITVSGSYDLSMGNPLITNIK